MRKIAILAIAGAVAASMSLAAGPAGASVAAKSSKKFCNAVTSSFEKIQSGSTRNLDEKAAASIAKALNKAAKSAPNKKVKKATKTLAGLYDRIAHGDSPAEVFRDEAEAYTKAATTFSSAYLSSCVANITIPKITIPKITIPGG